MKLCFVSRMVIACCLLVTAILGPGAGVARAGNGEGVGVVAEYRPPSAKLSVHSATGNVRRPIGIGSVVGAGDRVDLPRGATLVVHFADGSVRTYDKAGTVVMPAADPLGPLERVLRVGLSFVDADYRLAGMAAGRGGDDCLTEGHANVAIEVPAFPGGEAFLRAGLRDLPLAWRGGCGPFSITVTRAQGARVMQQATRERQLRLDGLMLLEGTYEIVITDADGSGWRGLLETLPSSPATPPELLATTTNLGIVARAAWLSGQDDGRWRLEAFDMLRPLIRAGDKLAGALGDSLMWGMSDRSTPGQSTAVAPSPTSTKGAQ